VCVCWGYYRYWGIQKKTKNDNDKDDTRCGHEKQNIWNTVVVTPPAKTKNHPTPKKQEEQHHHHKKAEEGEPNL
jgi:hypothetical protein